MADTNTLTQKDRAEQASPESTRGDLYFTPRVDIYESDNELTLYADVPGCRSQDVDLRFENGELILYARVKRRHPEQEFLLQEYEEGDFYRVFTVHESIDSSRIAAECKDGVLTVHLAKAEAVKPKQISVRG
jgi:HSP20 family protein